MSSNTDNEPIDFVLPWVDGSDPVWQKRKAEYSNSTQTIDGNIDARFRDMDTLKYVLRSIEQHCPWYNKIYLITESHFPEFLNREDERLIHVTHDELYFNKEHLPTFNSSSIEMNLPNLIPLSEKFIYMNDDFIIWNHIDSTRFFKNGKPIDFLYHGWIPRNKIFGFIRKRDTWIHSINHNISLINQYFSPSFLDYEKLFHYSYGTKVKISNFLLRFIYKRYFWFEHWHHPQPYLKKTLLEVFKIYKKEMQICSSNRFRSNNDLTQYLYRYWHLAQGEFYPHKHNDGLVANLDSMIRQLEKRSDINFVCFNDSTKLSDEHYDEVKSRLQNFLEQRFPQKASFEI